MNRPDPQISSIEAAAYRVPTDRPEGDGTRAWDSTTLVVIHAHAGGEVGTGWTYAPAATVRFIDQLLAPVVVAKHTPLAPRATQEAMIQATRHLGPGGLVGMAISAIDVAVWDLGAHILGIPLNQWFGTPPSPVPVYGSGGFTTYSDDELTTELYGWLALGVPRMKIKVGDSQGHREARDLRRVELARTVVGEDIELYVDANGSYTRSQARRLGRQLEALGISWFEQPVISDDLTGLAQVRDALDIDIAGGADGRDLPYFHRLAPAVDCLQIDLTRCGGYTEWQRIAAVASAHGVTVSGHGAPYLTLPIAMATPGLRHVEWFHDHVRLARELIEGWTAPIDGALSPADAPGHGLRLRGDRAAPYRVA